MAKRVTLSDQQIEKMKNQYLMQEQPLQKIAIDLGVSVPTVSRYLRQAGVAIRSKGRRAGAKHVTPVVNNAVEDTVTFPVPETTPVFKF